MSNNLTSYTLYQFSAKQYSCYDGYCSSFFGKLIEGSNDSIATECAKDQNCKSFRYNHEDGFGLLCRDSDVKKKLLDHKNWKVCRIGSSK